MKIKLRKANFGDLEEIARIHKSAYSSEHFSSLFSKEHLMQYYGLFIEHNEYCYVAEIENGSIAGFIIAGRKTGIAVNEFINRNRIAVFGYLLTSPKILFEKIISYVLSKLKKMEMSKASLRLLSIATDDKNQGKGIGGQMIDQFESELKKANEMFYGLSVRKGNNRAIKFYDSLGFETEKLESDNLYFTKKVL